MIARLDAELTQGSQKMSWHIPKVAIGLPVYNGGDSLANAIETLLGQTHKDFILFISDNCSTDQTESICLAYAENDSRISYTRQTENIGADRNFAFVLDQAKSEYFLWAAADDFRSADYLEANLKFLEAHCDYVSSSSPARFENGEFDEISMGDSVLTGTAEERFLQFFSSWHANSRFYGLFRREVLLESFRVARPYLGSDWTIMLSCCLTGKTNRCREGWLIRGSRGISNSMRIFNVYPAHWLHTLAPFSDMTLAVYQLTRGFTWNTRFRLAWRLVKLNLKALKTRRHFMRIQAGQTNAH